MVDYARRTPTTRNDGPDRARDGALVGMESMRVYPRQIDLAGYEATTGIAKNGSPYTTLRHDELATITAFGHAGEALKEAWDRGDVVRVDSYERSGTIKVVAIACPVTGLPIGQDGRIAPTAEAPVFEAAPEPKPEGLWDRMVDAVQDMLGIEDDEPKPEPVMISPGRTGYPFVDHLIDDVRTALAENPNLIDANGGRFDLVIEKHLPRMAAQHAETVRGATPEETKLADAMLSEGLKVTRTSFQDALSDHRSMKLDALAIEMNFLRSRQGMESTFAPQLSIEPQPRTLRLQAMEQPRPVEERRPLAIRDARSSFAKGPSSRIVDGFGGKSRFEKALAEADRPQPTRARGPKDGKGDEAALALMRASHRRGGYAA